MLSGFQLFTTLRSAAIVVGVVGARRRPPFFEKDELNTVFIYFKARTKKIQTNVAALFEFRGRTSAVAEHPYMGK